MAYFRWIAVFALALLVGISAPGCADKPKVQENKAASHLRMIATAFDNAQLGKGKTIQNADDLKPYLQLLSKKESVDEFLRSPNDGEPYEIMWGVNLERQNDLSLIFAHEKKGADGKRWVINVGRITMQMTDADFAAASFARGKR